MDDLTITSIVATGKLSRELELEAVADDLEAYSCQYNPEQPPGLHLKFYEDGPTVTMFRSGSFNVRGASTIDEAFENKSIVEERISNLGIGATVTNFSVTNMVFTADLERRLDLNTLSVNLGLENIEYEPEQFPGLVYRVEQGVILIFSSGKLVVTGFTDTGNAQRAYDKLCSKLTDV
jgi:transcription initiation factor TFIID TATA-box-binding protein